MNNRRTRFDLWRVAIISLAFVPLIYLWPQQERLEIKELSVEVLASNSTIENLIPPSKMINDLPTEASIQHHDDESIQDNKTPLEGQGWRKSLPLANFIATTDTQYEVCFVTSVYSFSLQQGDKPPTVEVIQGQNPSFRFFAFTNLPNLEAPGWKIRVKSLDQYYKRLITQSRWAKFMAWEDPEISLVSGWVSGGDMASCS